MRLVDLCLAPLALPAAFVMGRSPDESASNVYRSLARCCQRSVSSQSPITTTNRS